MGVLEFIVIAAVLCFAVIIVTSLLSPPPMVVKMMWALVGLVLLFMFLRAVGFVDPTIPRVH